MINCLLQVTATEKRQKWAKLVGRLVLIGLFLFVVKSK